MLRLYLKWLGLSQNAATSAIRSFKTSLTPTIGEILSNPPANNSEITAFGHIKSIRTFKNIGFIDISDGSVHQTLNVVFSDPESVFSEKHYKVGQSISINGKWTESQGNQKFELQYDHQNPGHHIEIMGNVPETYPIQKKSQTLQFLRNVPTLRHRTSTLASILRFRSNVEAQLMTFFAKNGFVKVSPPMITSSDCEGAGEQFKIEPFVKAPATDSFFGKEAFLTVSTQLHLEVLALSLNRAWTLTPCFRAEDSNTNRHLSEFWMLEAEVCYVDHVSQMTGLVENMIRLVVSQLKAAQENPGSLSDLASSRYSKEEAQTIEQRWSTVLAENLWPSITYTEAIEIINLVKNKGKLKGRMAWGDAILTEHEKWIAGVHFKCPVFITDFPLEQKPFYMPLSHESVFNSERPTVACFDLIIPEIGELVGGSLREANFDKLVGEMKRRNMSLDEMQWYLSTRENGTVPHGGFGMGFERLIAYLGAVENIKDVTAFPRAPGICPC